ncbi:hypothetical protein ACFLZH_00430 [Patescibacteria group bacterium]
MKKSLIIYLLGAVFLLTGCFGGGEDTLPEIPVFEGFSTYNASTFAISIPDAWEVIEPRDFTEDIPAQTQIIFKDNVKSDRFTTNANITKQLLNYPMTSLEFGRSEIAGNKTTLLNYREISRNDEFKLIVGDKLHNTAYILFEGKQSEGQPTLRIVQTFAVNGADAYTVTVAYLKNGDELVAEIAGNIIETFKVK